IEGKRPNASTHPGRVAALAEGEDIKGFEPDGLFFVEPAGGQGLITWLTGRIETVFSRGRIDPLSLPAGRYLNDDVPFFPEVPSPPSDAAPPSPASPPPQPVF